MKTPELAAWRTLATGTRGTSPAAGAARCSEAWPSAGSGRPTALLRRGVSSTAAITPSPPAARGGAALAGSGGPGHRPRESPRLPPGSSARGKERRPEAAGDERAEGGREGGREGTAPGPPRGAPERAAPVQRSSPAQDRPPRRYLEARPTPAPPARGPHPSAGQTRPPGAAAWRAPLAPAAGRPPAPAQLPTPSHGSCGAAAVTVSPPARSGRLGAHWARRVSLNCRRRRSGRARCRLTAPSALGPCRCRCLPAAGSGGVAAQSLAAVGALCAGGRGVSGGLESRGAAPRLRPSRAGGRGAPF